VRRVLLAAVSAALLAPAPSDARERIGEVVSARAALPAAKSDILPSVQPGAFPGQRPADSRLWASVAVAVEFWRERGITGCPDGIAAYTVLSFPFDDSALAAAASATSSQPTTG
jgi:hypothetical protein